MKKEARLRQIFAWLCREYPTAYPVKFGITTKIGDDVHGFTSRSGRTFYIFLAKKIPLAYAIDYLLHEYAHAIAWRHEKIERRKIDMHDAEWGLAYAELYRRFYDDHGWEESKEL